MNYDLCNWNDGGDSSHTIIKQGQDAVSQWLRECLLPGDLGCPEEIIEQLDVLDDAAGHGGSPIQITWRGNDYTYSITEITDLGALTHRELMIRGMTPLAIGAVRSEVQTAWKYLNEERFKTRGGMIARDCLLRVLTILKERTNG